MLAQGEELEEAAAHVVRERLEDGPFARLDSPHGFPLGEAF
jgi:hypothetical protein